MSESQASSSVPVAYSPKETYHFKLDKRGRVTMYWSTKSFQLVGLQLSCGSPDSTAFASSMTLKSVTKTVDKGGEVFGLIIEGTPNKRWLVRAKDKDSFAHAHQLLTHALCQHNAHEVENYGLPPIDPRVHLPYVDVPQMHVSRFGLLGKAVLFLFEDVVEVAEVIDEDEEEEEETGKPKEPVAPSNNHIQDGFGAPVAEHSLVTHETVLAEVSRVLILGDRCLYICTESSDIERCIRIGDIQMLFITKNDEGVGIRMVRDTDGSVMEPDLLLKCFNTKAFVDKLVKVYNFLRHNRSNLPIEYNLDEDELINNMLSLHIPDNWTLKLTLPTARKNLAKTLEVIEENQRALAGQGTLAYSQSVTAAHTPNDASEPHAHSNLVSAPSVGMVTLPSFVVLPQNVAPCAEYDLSDAEDDAEKQKDGVNIKQEVLMTDPLGIFLTKLAMPQYYPILRRQHVDWEVFRVFEFDDMACFGIVNEAHRNTILEHVMDEDFIRAVEDHSRTMLIRQKEGKPVVDSGNLSLGGSSLSGEQAESDGIMAKSALRTRSKISRPTPSIGEETQGLRRKTTVRFGSGQPGEVDLDDLDDFDLAPAMGRKKSVGLLPSLSMLDDDFDIASPQRNVLSKIKSFHLDADLFGSIRFPKASPAGSPLSVAPVKSTGAAVDVDLDDLDDFLASPRVTKKRSVAQLHIQKQRQAAVIDLDDDELLASPRRGGVRVIGGVSLDDI